MTILFDDLSQKIKPDSVGHDVIYSCGYNGKTYGVVVTSRTESLATFIEVVVMPEIAAVLAKYEKDIVELGKEQ